VGLIDRLLVPYMLASRCTPTDAGPVKGFCARTCCYLGVILVPVLSSVPALLSKGYLARVF
jgi:hypothetical protein